jgi:uncharacterized integral membrane protein
MKLKAEYLVVLMVMFLGVIFLDQNRTAVPVKFILGNPYQLELSTIIFVSALMGMLIAFVVSVFYRRWRQKKSQ